MCACLCVYSSDSEQHRVWGEGEEQDGEEASQCFLPGEGVAGLQMAEPGLMQIHGLTALSGVPRPQILVWKEKTEM